MKKLLFLTILFLAFPLVSHASFGTGSLNQGLVGHWTLDSTTGAQDLSGNQNNGTGQGGITIGGAADQHGQGGRATSFNGSTNYVSVPDSNSLSVTSGTFTGWIKFTSAPAGAIQTLMGKGNGGFSGTNPNYQIDIRGSGKIELAFRGNDSSGNEYKTNSAVITDTNWHNITIVYNSGTTIYLDGVVRSGSCVTGTCNMPLGTNSNPFYVGTLGDLNNKLNGSLSDLRIYNRALSASEVKALYNSYRF